MIVFLKLEENIFCDISKKYKLIWCNLEKIESCFNKKCILYMNNNELYIYYSKSIQQFQNISIFPWSFNSSNNIPETLWEEIINYLENKANDFEEELKKIDSDNSHFVYYDNLYRKYIDEIIYYWINFYINEIKNKLKNIDIERMLDKIKIKDMIIKELQKNNNITLDEIKNKTKDIVTEVNKVINKKRLYFK